MATKTLPAENQTAPPQSEKLSFWRKLGYGLGDIYGGGASTLISFYYLYFLTDVVLLNPALAGTVILISKVYDAITDPLEGVIADRTRTRLGRRKPYLLAGIPLIFLSFFALFYPVALESMAGRFAFVVATYLFFSTIVSIVMLNYNALQSELSLDYDERTSLSSFRIFFSTFASILAAVLPLQIVDRFPSTRQGFVAMGLAFGALFAVPFIATVISVRERREFQKPPEAFRWRQAFVEPFRMRTFTFALAMYLFTFVAMDAVSSIVVYYMTYYLGRGGEADFVAGTLLVAQVVSLPFYVWLSKRTSKRTGFMAGAAVWVVAMLFSFLIVPEAPAFAVYLFAAAVGFGTGGIVIMIYAIFPDIPDVDELETGERREGMYAALITFVRKLSGAVAIFIVANLIGLAGFVAPVEQVVDGVARLVEQPQSAQFIFTLRAIFAGVPIVLVTLALLFAYRYPLTPQVHARLNRLLAARRYGEPDEDDAREAAELEQRLIGSR